MSTQATFRVYSSLHERLAAEKFREASACNKESSTDFAKRNGTTRNMSVTELWRHCMAILVQEAEEGASTAPHHSTSIFTYVEHCVIHTHVAPVLTCFYMSVLTTRAQACLKTPMAITGVLKEKPCLAAFLCFLEVTRSSKELFS